jgi:hypothetical protein
MGSRSVLRTHQEEEDAERLFMRPDLGKIVRDRHEPLGPMHDDLGGEIRRGLRLTGSDECSASSAVSKKDT